MERRAPVVGAALSIEQSARRVAAWAWAEGRLYEVTGSWVPSTVWPAAKVWLGSASQHHRYRAPAFAIGREAEDKFHSAFFIGEIRPLALIEILIDVTALRGVGFRAADGGRPRQRLPLFREPALKHGSCS